MISSDAVTLNHARLQHGTSEELNEMTRARLILSGVTLTVVAVAAVLVLSVDTLSAAFTPSARAAAPADDSASVNAQAEQLLTELEQMEANLQAMQEHEGDYTRQIEEANQQIEDLNTTLAQVEAEAQSNQDSLADYESQIQYANNVAAEMRNSISVMQGRETEWLAQIDLANQTVGELQAYIDQYHAAQASAANNSSSNNNNRSGSHDDDHHDDDDHDEHEDDDD